MSADPPRKAYKYTCNMIRPQIYSEKSLMESVVDFFSDVVPQAYTGTQKPEDKEKIQWVRFENCDSNDVAKNPDLFRSDTKGLPLLLILGYSNGVQIWYITPNGEAQEILSIRQGPVRICRILPNPDPVLGNSDGFSNKRPLVVMCDSSSAGQPYCGVKFVSLRTGDEVHSISFKTLPVQNIECNKRFLAIVFMEKVCLHEACQFQQLFWITSCYPCPGPTVNPIALTTRWLAYADKRLVAMHQSCGGMSGDGSQSYAATVISAAKGAFKGLSMFGEAMVNSVTGCKPPSAKRDCVQLDNGNRPGIVTVVDIQNIHNDHFNVNEDNEGDGLIAHFHAHANEPVSSMAFDPTGTLLVTACKLGHNFHVFRLMAHPVSSSLGAVHHLYTLHRGETTAKVIDISFNHDSRWITVSSHRGTTHLFPITPYGGAVNIRTHSKPHVVNRASRFHRSAGIDEFDHAVGRRSPVLSTSPSSSGQYDRYPTLIQQNTLNNNMGNPRLPPYPHPTTIYPAFQIKQPLNVALNPGNKNQSPSHSPTGLDNVYCVCAKFCTPRLCVIGSPKLDVERRDGGKRPVDSLFVMVQSGTLVEYVLEPRAKTVVDKVTDDCLLELNVVGRMQWNLQRLKNSPELRPPLPSNSPLILANEAITSQVPTAPDLYDLPGLTRQDSKDSLSSDHSSKDDSDEQWLSQVEIITHAGPHRRLWMGPQFSFKTYQENTTVLSSNSSSLLSQSPESNMAAMDMMGDEGDLESLKLQPTRSNPVSMPNARPAYRRLSGSDSPSTVQGVGPHSVPLLIEAGSFDQSPHLLDVYSNWTESTVSKQPRGSDDLEEDRLKETLADAMVESPCKDLEKLSLRHQDIPRHSVKAEQAGGQAGRKIAVGKSERVEAKHKEIEVKHGKSEVKSSADERQIKLPEKSSKKGKQDKGNSGKLNKMEDGKNMTESVAVTKSEDVNSSAEKVEKSTVRGKNGKMKKSSKKSLDSKVSSSTATQQTSKIYETGASTGDLKAEKQKGNTAQHEKLVQELVEINTAKEYTAKENTAKDNPASEKTAKIQHENNPNAETEQSSQKLRSNKDSKSNGKSPATNDGANNVKAPTTDDSKSTVKSPTTNDSKNNMKSPATSDDKSSVKTPATYDCQNNVMVTATSDCKSNVKSPAISDGKSNVKAPATSDSKSNVKSLAISDSKSNEKAPATNDSKSNVKSPAISDCKSNVKARSTSESKSSVKSAATNDSKSNLQSTATNVSKSNVKAAATNESKSNVKSTATNVSKSNVKATATNDSKSNVKATATNDSKNNVKSTATNDSESSVKSSATNDSESNGKSPATSDSESNVKSTATSDSEGNVKSPFTSDGKSNVKSTDKRNVSSSIEKVIDVAEIKLDEQNIEEQKNDIKSECSGNYERSSYKTNQTAYKKVSDPNTDGDLNVDTNSAASGSSYKTVEPVEKEAVNHEAESLSKGKSKRKNKKSTKNVKKESVCEKSTDVQTNVGFEQSAEVNVSETSVLSGDNNILETQAGILQNRDNSTKPKISEVEDFLGKDDGKRSKKADTEGKTEKKREKENAEEMGLFSSLDEDDCIAVKESVEKSGNSDTDQTQLYIETIQSSAKSNETVTEISRAKDFSTSKSKRKKKKADSCERESVDTKQTLITNKETKKRYEIKEFQDVIKYDTSVTVSQDVNAEQGEIIHSVQITDNIKENAAEADQQSKKLKPTTRDNTSNKSSGGNECNEDLFEVKSKKKSKKKNNGMANSVCVDFTNSTEKQQFFNMKAEDASVDKEKSNERKRDINDKFVIEMSSRSGLPAKKEGTLEEMAAAFETKLETSQVKSQNTPVTKEECVDAETLLSEDIAVKKDQENSQLEIASYHSEKHIHLNEKEGANIEKLKGEMVVKTEVEKKPTHMQESNDDPEIFVVHKKKNKRKKKNEETKQESFKPLSETEISERLSVSIAKGIVKNKSNDGRNIVKEMDEMLSKEKPVIEIKSEVTSEMAEAGFEQETSEHFEEESNLGEKKEIVEKESTFEKSEDDLTPYIKLGSNMKDEDIDEITGILEERRMEDSTESGSKYETAESTEDDPSAWERSEFEECMEDTEQETAVGSSSCLSYGKNEDYLEEEIYDFSGKNNEADTDEIKKQVKLAGKEIEGNEKEYIEKELSDKNSNTSEKAVKTENKNILYVPENESDTVASAMAVSRYDESASSSNRSSEEREGSGVGGVKTTTEKQESRNKKKKRKNRK